MRMQTPAAAAPRRALPALRERLPRTASRRRTTAAVALATIGLVGLGTASAAMLDTNAGTLATGSAGTTTCQAGAPFSAQLSSAPSGAAFATTGVVVSGVNAACTGESYRISLVADDGTQLAEAAGTVVAGGTIAATVPSVPTAAVASVEVVIH